MQNGISANASSTSTLVTVRESRALIIAAYRPAGPSNHPQRRGRPVVEPYSFPRLRSCAPASTDSVGNGPPPTRVVYALQIPRTRWTYFGEIPTPAGTPPAAALDDVTYGNVPLSTSSIVP